MEHFAIFYGHTVLFWTFGIFCGHLVKFFPFWYDAPRRNLATLARGRTILVLEQSRLAVAPRSNYTFRHLIGFPGQKNPWMQIGQSLLEQRERKKGEPIILRTVSLLMVVGEMELAL
jgi:hypothetical protein